MRAPQAQRQHESERRADHQRRADDVELVRPVIARQTAQRAFGHDQSGTAERDVDPENERPVQVVGQQTANHRAENAGAHEHDRGAALHHRAFARREQIGNDGLRDRQQTAAADALQSARDNQHPERRRQRAGDRAEDENADGEQQNGTPPVDVGELAEQRRGGGQREKISSDHPGQIIDIAEALADGGQCRRDDRLFERGEEHRQHDAGDDGADRGVIERRRRWMRGGPRIGTALLARGNAPGSGDGARSRRLAGILYGDAVGILRRRFACHVGQVSGGVDAAVIASPFMINPHQLACATL